MAPDIAHRVIRQSDIPKLHIFISYATEDAVLAQAINGELKNVFSDVMIRTTLDTELKLGVDWRRRLEEALQCADILLIVATGRQKLSHSYTGFEVGFFSASKLTNKDMAYFNSERIIIPIGVLEKNPETIADVESLNLDGALAPFLLDEDTLKNKEQFLEKMTNDTAKNPLRKLFSRLKEIVQTRYPFDDEATDKFRQRARESADRLLTTFFEEFQRRVFIERFPERKIIVRLPTHASIESLGDIPASTTLEFTGGTFEIFRINVPPDRTIAWDKFIKQMPQDAETSTSWADIIKSLIITAKKDDFAENRRLLASADRKRFFRLFVGRSVVYYSGIAELHIYVVEVKARDYGDPITTMLLKAMTVGLIYRSLFLEDDSQFSPQTIRATLPRDLPKAVSELLQELDYVLWMSTDAGLSLPRNINILLRGLERGGLERRVNEWERQKLNLTASALEVIRSKDETQLIAAKETFEDCLREFCESTVPMNEEFLSNVLDKLSLIVRKSSSNGTKAPGVAVTSVEGANRCGRSNDASAYERIDGLAAIRAGG